MTDEFFVRVVCAVRDLLLIASREVATVRGVDVGSVVPRELVSTLRSSITVTVSGGLASGSVVRRDDVDFDERRDNPCNELSFFREDDDCDTADRLANPLAAGAFIGVCALFPAMTPPVVPDGDMETVAAECV